MKTRTINVYEFHELNEKAKEHALDKLRYLNVEFDEWWDFVYEDFKTFCQGIGIEVEQINFTLSYSQGDGCAFKASIDLPKLLKAIESQEWKKNYPKETIEFYPVTANMKRISRLMGRGLIDGKCWVRQTNRETSSEFENEWGVKNPNLCDPVNVNKALNELEQFMEHLTKTLDHWLFDNLKKELEYRMSDEAVIESIEANEYEFDEKGNLI